MSEESLDYLKLCPNYYTNWEDGCCMESCAINDMSECPIHYVKGLLAEKDKAIENWQTMYASVMHTCHNDKEEIERLREQIALTEKALELVCERVKYFEEMQDKEMGFSEFFGYDSDYDLKAIIEQYKEYAKEMMKSE